MKQCSSCVYMKRLRGAKETRWGCYRLLIALRPLPGEEELVWADEIDVVALLRAGYTTREHIQCATRITPECGACQWWKASTELLPKLDARRANTAIQEPTP